jgi:hypothetical protein
MWKPIILCASLFGGGAVGLAAGARWIDPMALPAAAAIGLCVIGIVLILVAPSDAAAAAAAPSTAASREAQVPRPRAQALRAVDETESKVDGRMACDRV